MRQELPDDDGADRGTDTGSSKAGLASVELTDDLGCGYGFAVSDESEEALLSVHRNADPGKIERTVSLPDPAWAAQVAPADPAGPAPSTTTSQLSVGEPTSTRASGTMMDRAASATLMWVLMVVGASVMVAVVLMAVGTLMAVAAARRQVPKAPKQ